jgi:GxxExxY protein
VEDSEMLYEEKTYEIIGAAMEVHRELGSGFLEGVYQEALEKEFTSKNIEFERETQLDIHYKGVLLSKRYIADFICYNSIIIELKALKSLNSEHEAQVLNYLKATKFKLGLLINFGNKTLTFKRLIN